MEPLMKAYSGNPTMTIHDLFGKNDCQCYRRFAFCGYTDKNYYQRRKLKRRRQPVPPELEVLELEPGPEIYSKRKLQFHWNQAQAHTRDGALQGYPNIRQKIDNFKRTAVLEALALDNDRFSSQESMKLEVSLDQWTLVGFSQRKARRRWLNLDRVLQRCLEEWRHLKIACVEINLDTPDGQDPENQVVMHAGLDALIG